MWKKDLPSASHVTRKLICFRLGLLHSFIVVSIFHMNNHHFFRHSCLVQKDSLNQPPVNVLVFADFNIQLKVSLTHSGKLCYNSRSPLTLLRLLIFLIQCLNVMLRLVLFMIHFYFPNLVFVLQWSSLHWRILFNLLSQFPLISV